ncbi:hypothetical protein P152DRAFT_460315 [Eremomyces bilateralis CBS 781.70]|uniref:Uncharacterized protein n=1 Tax=Eremomyces bilateralis CBS 781.70 TaxID=1392243 RepID=A0A6G1FY63_9PEZI|nr:uncharacterized protein P152DRAFT_460315 [Eremomyces bilateralis CBS 781.70]KAF1810616.1 hypothetical protein P152DRAFT_460315 [Eremomyces bilateralis CBS 781.70]
MNQNKSTTTVPTPCRRSPWRRIEDIWPCHGQPNGLGTQSEYYMHQLGAYAMTSNNCSFVQGATTCKNALELAAEYWDTLIAPPNLIAAQRIENTAEDEDAEVEEGEEDEDDEENVAPSAIPIFANPNPSMQAKNEDDDDDECESAAESQTGANDSDDESEGETSVEDNYPRCLPTKRSSSKSHSRHYHRSRKTCKSSIHQSSAATESEQKRRGSWFLW